jgi:WD40-like Beta Propeller Repeat
VIAPLVAATALATAEPVQPRLLTARSGAIVRLLPNGSRPRPLLEGADAAWSPDGTLVALARTGDLWVANDEGSGARRLLATPAVAESEPGWAPDGRTLVYTASVDDARQIRLVRLNAPTSRRLASSGGEEWSAAFSPDGRRIAFVSSRTGAAAIFTVRADGTEVAQVGPAAPPEGQPAPTAVRDLAWSPDGGALAYTAELPEETAIVVERPVGGTRTVLSPSPARDERPVWSPDGLRLAFDTLGPDGARELKVMGADGSGAHTIGRGAALDWRRVPVGAPLLPDLDQRPPSGLTVTASRGRFLLGFTSLVDNRGPGILWIRALRPLGSPIMDARQLVQLSGGGVRAVRSAGLLRYTVAPPHYHWHLLDFDRYELRRAGDFALVARDRKTGFCIADHYGLARGIRHGPPRFLGNCRQFDPTARTVEEGSSVGYTDRYPANFHGQNLDLTGIPTGRYWIVHRANDYDNDAASLLVRLTWPDGRRAPPRVEPLRACERDRC